MQQNNIILNPKSSLIGKFPYDQLDSSSRTSGDSTERIYGPPGAEIESR
jgi:hypothetical protein